MGPGWSLIQRHSAGSKSANKAYEGPFILSRFWQDPNLAVTLPHCSLCVASLVQKDNEQPLDGPVRESRRLRRLSNCWTSGRLALQFSCKGQCKAGVKQASKNIPKLTLKYNEKMITLITKNYALPIPIVYI